jgi:hypothetical protein
MPLFFFTSFLLSLLMSTSTTERPPRPPNCWILYHRDKQAEILLEQPEFRKDILALSTIISKLWKEEDAVVKALYKTKADEEKALHLIRHPGYKYNPVRQVATRC